MGAQVEYVTEQLQRHHQNLTARLQKAGGARRQGPAPSGGAVPCGERGRSVEGNAVITVHKSADSPRCLAGMMRTGVCSTLPPIAAARLAQPLDCSRTSQSRDLCARHLAWRRSEKVEAC